MKIGVEPTEAEVSKAFEERIDVLERRGKREKAAAASALRRLWAAGEVSKKAAFMWLNFGVVTDEVEAVLD